MEGRPPGQRLAHCLQQSEILRSGQDPTSGLRIVIDETLKVRKDVRCALHLVDHRTVGQSGQETTRILGGEGVRVRSFERHVRMIGEERAA